MSLLDRENQRRSNSVVGALVNSTENEEKEVFKPKSYYITKELYKAVGIKATLDGVDKSAVVRKALTEYLKDTLEEYKDALK